MLTIGPLEKMYGEGVNASREKMRAANKEIKKDFKKLWAVKRSFCDVKNGHIGYNMEEEYEIIGEFDKWSQAMNKRNNIMNELDIGTFVAIDDPEATHWTIVGGTDDIDSLRMKKYVKVWCVINVDFLDEREKELNVLVNQMEICEKLLNEMLIFVQKIQDHGEKRKFGETMQHLANQMSVKHQQFKRLRVIMSLDPKELKDHQPGIELRYTYHKDCTFIPMGVSMGPDDVQFNVSSQGTPFIPQH